MADLDDFFAKKDRKKNKSNKKFATTEEVAKKLEDTAKKTSEKLKKERIPEGDENAESVQEQDEWKDFEEEKKDYTGLKIGNLTINQTVEGNQGTTDQVNTEQQQGYDETNQENDRKAGPWKRLDSEQQEEVVTAPVEKKPEPQTNTKTGTYIPPSLRNQNQQPIQPSRLKSKAAPDIHNEEYFPTLSKTGDFKKNKSEGSFEVVAHNRSSSHRQTEQSKMSSGQGSKISLGNRYNTLSNDS